MPPEVIGEGVRRVAGGVTAKHKQENLLALLALSQAPSCTAALQEEPR